MTSESAIEASKLWCYCNDFSIFHVDLVMHKMLHNLLVVKVQVPHMCDLSRGVTCDNRGAKCSKISHRTYSESLDDIHLKQICQRLISFISIRLRLLQLINIVMEPLLDFICVKVIPILIDIFAKPWFKVIV